MIIDQTHERPSFLGIAIKGDISRGDRRKPQRTKEEFAAIIQAILDDPTVAEFGWRQYTPYFNDGEPCVFGAHGAWVRLDTDAPAAEDEEDYEETERLTISYGSDDRIGERPVLRCEGVYPDRHAVYGAYAGPDEARYDRLKALDEAIDDNEFDDVLLDLFGDHSEITVRRDGIQVDTYSHD